MFLQAGMRNFMTLLRLLEADCINPEKERKETSETEDPMGLIVQLNPLQLYYLSSKGNGKATKSCATRWVSSLCYCVLQTAETQSPCGLSSARIKPT